MIAALRIWVRLRSAGSREDRVPGLLAVVAFAVAAGGLLVTLGGVAAFQGRFGGAGPDDIGYVYLMFAYLAAGLLVVPTLTLGGVAARLAAARRDRRLATLRLAGATSGQVSVMTLAEAVTQALTGAVLGVGVYAAAIVPVSWVPFQGRSFSVGQLWLGPLAIIGVVLAVTVLALVAGLSSLRRVVVSPLGVTARHTPARLRATRVVVVVVAGAAWLAVAQVAGELGAALFAAMLAGFVATINIIGPFVVMLLGLLLAQFARTPETLLAARRIVDDPRSTWRAVGALGIGMTVAAVATYSSALSPPDANAEDRLLAHDVGTGALLMVVIIAAVAATSTGVVQAARVFDQHEQYRALALAGTDLRSLHRARTREVLLPAMLAIGLRIGFMSMVIVPFSHSLPASVPVRLLGMATVALLMMAGAVAASRGLVARAAAAT